MQAIPDVVLPVFAIMLAGYLAGRTKLLGEESSEALNGFVYYIALPGLFFGSLAEVDLKLVFNWPFIAAFGGGALATFSIALFVAIFAFPNRLGAVSLNALSAIFSNTGYMGIPLLQMAYGQEGILPAVITTVITGAVVMTLAVVLMELDRSQGHRVGQIFANFTLALLRSPLIGAAVLGILYAASGLALPSPVASFCALVGDAAGPAALFAIGLFMVGRSPTAGLGEVAWVTLLKLFVMPAVTWWLAFEVMRLDPLWAKAAVIQAALPTGALMFVIAQRYGIYIQRATAIIMLSTVVSLITLSLLFTLFSAR